MIRSDVVRVNFYCRQNTLGVPKGIQKTEYQLLSCSVAHAPSMKGGSGELTLNIRLIWINPHGIRNVDDVTAIERSRIYDCC
jgi:hypothetical protein